MSDAPKCETCGSDVPADAPGGGCPRCALSAALSAPEAGPTPDEVAAKLPGFEILGVLGKGGMGVVFKARQKALDRIVALKVLPPESAASPGFAERFQREAKAMARLAHPNIVAVHEFGESGGLFYLVLEFVDGANIREATAAGRVGPADALTIVPQICDALQYAHDRGVVHRDIKPENVLIARDGRVKIADFGLAKLADREAGDVSLTGAGQVMGTLRYMAPEQWERPKDVDHRADIYSLGVVFYEMLTGELPMGRFEPPSKRASMDVRIDEVVMRSIERDRERRWQRADEMKTHVSALSTPAASSPPPAVVVEKKKKKKEDDSHWDWEGPQGMNAVTMWAVTAICAVAALAWDYGDWLWWVAGPAAITGAWCTAKWWSDRPKSAAIGAEPAARPLGDDLFGPAAPGARWSRLALLLAPATLSACAMVADCVHSVSDALYTAFPIVAVLGGASAFAWFRIRHARGALRGLALAGAGMLAAAALVPFAALRAWHGESRARDEREWNLRQDAERERLEAELALHPRVVEGIEIPGNVRVGGEQEFVQRPRIEALVRRLQAVHPTADFDVLAKFYGSEDLESLRRLPAEALAAKAPRGALGLPVFATAAGEPALSEFQIFDVTVESDHGDVVLQHDAKLIRLVVRVERLPGSDVERRWVFSMAPVERMAIPLGGFSRKKPAK